ncbi:MAG: hypothetical protein WDA71_09670 [Actinomycetota bacterium]
MPPPKRADGRDIRGVSRKEALSYASQAEEYLRSAEQALDRGDHNSAAGNAVLAGINAADAVSGVILGNRWAGAHTQAPIHAGKAGHEGLEVARELRRLVPAKTQAQYEPDPISKVKAEQLVAAARRAVGVARRVVATIP